MVEPGQLGGGVYSTGQPDYLVLNNACGQLSLHAAPDHGRPPYAVGSARVGRRPRATAGSATNAGSVRGAPILPTDYLPRRLMGEYLVWCYDALVADAPPNLEIVRHVAAALDIAPLLGGRETVLLDNGTDVVVDHVVLTSGHTFNDEAAGDPTRFATSGPIRSSTSTSPCPRRADRHRRHGLVGFDLLTALTVGRGGTFEDVGTASATCAAAGSPIIYLYSRSGVPYCAKSAHGVDSDGDYQPVVCTPEGIRELTNPGGSALRRQVDFRHDLLPLLFAEMQARYLHPCRLLERGRRRGGVDAGRLQPAG